jgi:hypothetical protein
VGGDAISECASSTRKVQPGVGVTEGATVGVGVGVGVLVGVGVGETLGVGVGVRVGETLVDGDGQPAQVCS